jgi:hypothetical protein
MNEFLDRAHLGLNNELSEAKTHVSMVLKRVLFMELALATTAHAQVSRMIMICRNEVSKAWKFELRNPKI